MSPLPRINDRTQVVSPVQGDLVAAVASAGTAELSWTEDASPRARAVVPLVAQDRPVLAVPYAQAAWARSLATRPRVVLTLSDRRLSGSAWQPLRITAVPRVEEDRDGDAFLDTLLQQELRKHPPSRALAESPLLRREQWWYLPRLLVHLEVRSVEPFVARSGEREVLLVTARPGAVHEPQVRAARVDWGSRPLGVEPLDGEMLADSPEGLLYGHDFTVPDLERWVSFAASGPLRSGALDAEAPADRVADRMPGLRERVRRHRELRRGCVSALRDL